MQEGTFQSKLKWQVFTEHLREILKELLLELNHFGNGLDNQQVLVRNGLELGGGRDASGNLFSGFVDLDCFERKRELD